MLMNPSQEKHVIQGYESAPLLRGSIADSFAYLTLRDRVPIILGKIVDTLSKKIHHYHLETSAEQVNTTFLEEGKFIISEMGSLRYHLVRDKPFPELRKDEDSNFVGVNWHQAIEKMISHEQKENRSWFKAPWLLSECLVYRMVQDIVMQTTTWKDYDVFFGQKQESFTKFLEPVHKLACFVEKYHEKEHVVMDDEVLQELIQISLWGNQMDLSLFVNLLDTGKHDHSNLAGDKDRVLLDDTEKAISVIRGLSSRTIVFVLDNAGFELFSDLCFADYLSSTTNCTIRFEMKSYPWFVSDTTQKDFDYVLQESIKVGIERNWPELVNCARRWTDWVKTGRWQLSHHWFWTSPYSFWYTDEVAPDLVKMLQESALVIFKGDLNYRKMVNDASWDPTTSFEVAIGPLAKVSIGPILMLRTCKSDTIAGLDPHVAEKMLASEEKDWMVSGKYGMIQFTE